MIVRSTSSTTRSPKSRRCDPTPGKAGYVKKPKRPTGDPWREALFDFGQLLRAEFGPRHAWSPELEKIQRLYVTRGFVCSTPQDAIEAVRQHFGRPPKSASLAIEDMTAEKEGEDTLPLPQER